jgi:hypothetical protein
MTIKQRTVEQIRLNPGFLVFFSPRWSRTRRIEGKTFRRYATSPLKEEAQELAAAIRMRWPQRRRFLVRVIPEYRTYYDVWISDR